MARLTFAQMTADHRVSDWSDERSVGGYYNDGIWLYLAPGWVTDEGLTTIHETTVRECSSELQAARYSPEEYVQSFQAEAMTGSYQVELLPGG